MAPAQSGPLNFTMSCFDPVVVVLSSLQLICKPYLIIGINCLVTLHHSLIEDRSNFQMMQNLSIKNMAWIFHFFSDITWTKHSTLTKSRLYHGSAVLNGTLYLLGGSGSASTTTERLDMATGQWSKGFDLKEALYKGCSVTISDVEVVTISTHFEGGSPGAMYKYNVETGTAEDFGTAQIQVPEF